MSAPSGRNNTKTILCDNFENDNKCKYGDACVFAHGIRDLRYKSQLCRYGVGCYNRDTTCWRYHIDEDLQGEKFYVALGDEYDRVWKLKNKVNHNVDDGKGKDTKHTEHTEHKTTPSVTPPTTNSRPGSPPLADSDVDDHPPRVHIPSEAEKVALSKWLDQKEKTRGAAFWEKLNHMEKKLEEMEEKSRPRAPVSQFAKIEDDLLSVILAMSAGTVNRTTGLSITADLIEAKVPALQALINHIKSSVDEVEETHDVVVALAEQMEGVAKLAATLKSTIARM